MQTRKSASEGKIRTRAMVKGEHDKKMTLIEAKAKSRQRMVKDPMTVVKDIYANALSTIGITRGETGVIYDESMALHCCLWDGLYPECPERFTSVINRCREMKLLDRCKKLEPRLSTKEEVLSIHTDDHYNLLESTKNVTDEEQLEDLSSHYDAIYIHPTTFDLSLLACGSTIELVDRIIDGDIMNGMAIIRPPGHHAMKAEYNGYCFFNNVAVAAQHAMDSRGLKKILIVDWDVHHGQGTQRAFYDDPRVLYFSIHRFEHGEFWPHLHESDFDYIGRGEGIGHNVNVPLNKVGMTNGDYLAIIQQLLMPIALEFQPELIIVSSGYDAAFGCPEGEMEVTPACYSHLLLPLMSLASGHVAVVLEGGYCLESLAEGAALTLRCLLGDPCPIMEPLSAPCESIQESILNCIYVHHQYWNNLCLQDVYSIEELNNVNPQSNLHKIPQANFIGGPPRPERFATRDCYPVQSEAFTRNVAERLQKLKFLTNLTFPANRVCYVYDEQMTEHKNSYESHPEQPERIRKIRMRLIEYELLDRMKALSSRVATDDELLLAHEYRHIDLMRQIVKSDDLYAAGDNYNSVYFHPSTMSCAQLAAGSMLQVVDDVLSGLSRSGIAVIRPPGHHAEPDEPHGFCIFNNVSVAAQYAIKNHGLSRVLIVDWDVHHGQGTQHIFYDNPKVLYVSIHRYDNGNFFPKSSDGNFTEVGEGAGRGFNVNIPWNKKGMSDMEYMLAFQNIIMPIAYDFDPELVLVSAGFDAAIGDQLGGCKVSAEAYGYFTHWLSALANGRIILCLEGGYNVNSISHSMALCVKALLGDPLPLIQFSSRWQGINPVALETLRNVINTQAEFWKCLKFNSKLPDFDVNENKILERDLSSDLEALNLNSPCDADHNANQSQKTEIPSTTSSEAGTSHDEIKAQTLKDFLSENMEALKNEEMYAVVPLKTCPHLNLLRPENVPSEIDHKSACEECQTAIENWICLICFKTYCSRYINEHSSLHHATSEHPLVISFTDLSCWCYECNAYIDNPRLHRYKDLIHRSKFNEELVWSYGDMQLELHQYDDVDSE